MTARWVEDIFRQRVGEREGGMLLTREWEGRIQMGSSVQGKGLVLGRRRDALSNCKREEWKKNQWTIRKICRFGGCKLKESLSGDLCVCVWCKMWGNWLRVKEEVVTGFRWGKKVLKIGCGDIKVLFMSIKSLVELGVTNLFCYSSVKLGSVP